MSIRFNGEMTPATDDPEYIALLKRRNRWLTVVIISAFLGGVPPLIGLGGTVFGMLRAFDTVGKTGGGDPEELSENISLALVTTAGGVIVSALFLIILLLSAIFWMIAASRVKNFRKTTRTQS